MLFHPDIYQFNDLRKKFPVLDVRSPGEYTKGHIPGAVNLPHLMQQLLESEGIKIENDKVENFKELFWDPAVHLKI
jgi:rhodanese-related sulfurtransferase